MTKVENEDIVRTDWTIFESSWQQIFFEIATFRAILKKVNFGNVESYTFWPTFGNIWAIFLTPGHTEFVCLCDA